MVFTEWGAPKKKLLKPGQKKKRKAAKYYGPTTHISLTDFNDMVSMACPICGNPEIYKLGVLINGTASICEKCGSSIRTNPGSTKPINVQAKTISLRDSSGATVESASFNVVTRGDGVWIFLGNEDTSIIETITHESDRSVAIVIGAFIENRLEQAILTRMNYRNEDVELALFRPSGPLGDFGVKIQLAHLLGLLSLEAHADFMNLKEIRNKFAHKSEIRFFGSDSVRDLAAKFKLIEGHVAETVLLPNGEHKFAELGQASKPTIFTKHADARKKLPKDRYLLTAQLLSIKFAVCLLKNAPLPLI